MNIHIQKRILQSGLGQLQSLQTPYSTIVHWRDFLLKNPDEWQHEDDPYTWLSCVQALLAIHEKNYGIGCILVDPQGEVIIQDHNQSFVPRYRTDMHAEMVVLNIWENMRTAPVAEEDYTLYSSLEPCPMCLTRLITSDIKHIRYVAPDEAGGMVQRLDQLPPIHREFAQRHHIAQVNALPTLMEAATHILHISMDELNNRFR